MDLTKQMQCNLTNIINMGHIETYNSVLSTVELIMRLKQDRGKWPVMFHTCIKLFRPTPVYVCLYYISGLKWSTTQYSNLTEPRQGIIYAMMKTIRPPGYHQNGFVATHALGHMMFYITVYHVPKCMSCQKAIVVITGTVYRFDDNIYITLIFSLWDLSTLCVVDHLWAVIYV